MFVKFVRFVICVTTTLQFYPSLPSNIDITEHAVRSANKRARVAETGRNVYCVLVEGMDDGHGTSTLTWESLGHRSLNASLHIIPWGKQPHGQEPKG